MSLRRLKIVSAVVGGCAIDVVLWRWMTPDEVEWVRIYREAASGHAIYDIDLTPGYWIQGTWLNTWLHGPQLVHVMGAIVVLALFVFSAAVLLEPRGATHD